MKTLLSPNFKLQEVTLNDLTIASLCWGFTFGFGFLTTWKAMKQTLAMYKRSGLAKVLSTPYIWMIWLEIFVCLLFSVVCWMHLRGFILPSFAFYFCILTLWALQVQFLLQIIISRIAVLMLNRRKALALKIVVAGLITAINISVYCIWIPSRLAISDTYIHINEYWDRCEKIIYLVVDAGLNWYFIRVVRRNLVNPGLKKYEPLVRFNMFIIGFSLAMDVLIIAMMSLKNSFVYMQFHPLAYIVKLNIEMAMSELITKVARAQNIPQNGGVVTTTTEGLSHGTRDEKHFALSTCAGGSNKTQDIELGMLKNAGPLSRPMTDLCDDDSSLLDDSEEDCDSVERNSPSRNQFVVRKKQEFHVQVETAPPTPGDIQRRGTQGFHDNVKAPRKAHHRKETSAGSQNW